MQILMGLLLNLYWKGRNNYIERMYSQSFSQQVQKNFYNACCTGKRFAYIFNPWAIDSTIFQNEARGGMAFQAMENNAIHDKKLKIG